jgi:hypothetical protein
MTITKDEASEALSEINAASGRLKQARAYARMAPFLIIWGLVWMTCDVGNQFAPRFFWAWPAGIVAGFVASWIVGRGMSKTASDAGDWRDFVVWLIVMAFVTALFFVLPATEPRQVHSVFGLVFGFIYLAFGLWTGWRMLALGVALIVATFVGFYEIGAWYSLYMGLVSGGALLLGGLWLRKI